MTNTIQTNLGELISAYYDEFLAACGDAELASELTAQAINDLLDTVDAQAPAARAA